MKEIYNYINEKLRLNRNFKNYSETPTTRLELIKILYKRLSENRHRTINLNDIDVSKIDDMNLLFANGFISSDILKPFREIDISEWNVSNLVNAEKMFKDCKNINFDLSSWDVSNLKNGYGMFNGCESFNCDLSRWNIENLENANSMFFGCKNFNSDLSGWNTKNLISATAMFAGCNKLNFDASNWDNSKLKAHKWMFSNTELINDVKNLPKWYLSK